MNPRRPLEPLPLACFLPLDNTRMHCATPLKPASKRSRSPSALMSPAKRRILRQEGCLATSSLEAKKGPSKGDISSRGCLESRVSPRIGDELQHDGVGSPFIDAVAHKARLMAPPTPTSSKPHISLSKHPSNASVLDTDGTADSIFRVVAPLVVPRELPPRPDPQSCHYPGFDIHYDTHVEIPSTSSLFKPDPELERDKEAMKENVHVRKMATKSTSMFAEIILCSNIGNAKPKTPSYPTTPTVRFPLRTPMISSAERESCSSTEALREFTPGRTRDNAGDKVTRRRALEQEVDDMDMDHDDEA